MISKRIRSVVLTMLAACGPGADCTLIGCDDSLTVKFTKPPVAPFRIEARGSPEEAPRVYECTDIATCIKAPILERFGPSVVTLTITYQGRSTARQVQPQYTGLYPNGKHCGAACRLGTVTVSLP
jgi:hypothetical protein